MVLMLRKRSLPFLRHVENFWSGIESVFIKEIHIHVYIQPNIEHGTIPLQIYYLADLA